MDLSCLENTPRSTTVLKGSYFKESEQPKFCISRQDEGRRKDFKVFSFCIKPSGTVCGIFCTSVVLKENRMSLEKTASFGMLNHDPSRMF